MSLVPLDRTKPLSDQIVLQYVERIERGELAEGTRMPSVRALALSLGVNRNTVAQVYKELAQKGYLVSRFGAGSTVRRPGPRPTRPEAPAPPAAPLAAPRRLTALEWTRRFASPAPAIALEAPPAVAGGEPPINLFHLHPYTGLFPLDAFRLCLNTVLRRSGAELLNYGSPAGYLPLRERIAARLKAQGVAAEPSRILITSGSQQGIDLLVRTFVNPGDSVVVEAPMYSIALKLFQMAGARLQPYAVTAQGVQLEALGQAGPQPPKLAYAVPNFQNPTTHCYSLAERQDLLRWVYRSGALLIEDASDAELHPDWPHIVPLAALDAAERVLHLNTFSKTLA
ncbi:MAG TPA: PLP-dependent aminotransferase family protein, partial [bacterium]|nr:PLP-dependent aminotransferase family protein [bacterium]